jgi:hypothetical protein
MDRGDGVMDLQTKSKPATFSTQALDFESSKSHAHYEPYSEGKTDIPE